MLPPGWLPASRCPGSLPPLGHSQPGTLGALCLAGRLRSSPVASAALGPWGTAKSQAGGRAAGGAGKPPRLRRRRRCAARA